MTQALDAYFGLTWWPIVVGLALTTLAVFWLKTRQRPSEFFGVLLFLSSCAVLVAGLLDKDIASFSPLAWIGFGIGLVILLPMWLGDSKRGGGAGWLWLIPIVILGGVLLFLLKP